MTIFKCKICGGDLEITAHEKVAECQYCGMKQTLPNLDDEQKANLYDRANHFRRGNEFDKAMSIFEQILNKDSEDAEAYWSLVLCRYGIEYVEDPVTHKRVPTVNRAQFTSIFDDEDYKSALRYADERQKPIYEAEAAAINEIQKGILAISQKEEPFDVFICYKETDDSGKRTPDSVLANDLYHQLTREGFKVFFSRITLEGKLGTAYEPYIFAALNSAKVMVVLGTKPEYFNAVWVKNEWSRYLALVKNSSGSKMLIPAYKGMDPYDLPEEFSHLQAQDMSKLGFMQDLIWGIRKIVAADKAKTAVKETVIVSGNADTEPLLKRMFLFLEDGDFESADEYCERVLDLEPENARAYLGKLMAKTQTHKQEQLADCKVPFDSDTDYQKIMRFGDSGLKNTLAGYIEQINERNEAARKEELYTNTVQEMESAIIQLEYQAAMAKFSQIPGYKDADKRVELCEKKIEEIKLREEETRLQLERKERLKKQIIGIAIAALVICIAIVIVLSQVLPPLLKYNEAMKSLEEGRYSEAYSAFYQLNGYKDSAEQLKNFLSVPTKIESVSSVGYKDTVEYSYDENGNVIKRIATSSHGGGEQSTSEYTYDTNGRVIKEISGGDCTGGCMSDYSYNGNVVKEITRCEDGEYITEYTYDENGYITTINDGERYYATYEYVYNNSENVREVSAEAPHGGSFTSQYTYDENDNMIEIRSEYANGYLHRIKYIYDENGNIIEKKEKVTDPSDGSHRTDTTTYSDYQVFYRPGKNNKIIPGIKQIDFLAFPQY